MAPSPPPRKRLRLHSVGRDRDDVERAFRVFDRLRRRKNTDSEDLQRADNKIKDLRKTIDEERAYSAHMKEQREELKAKLAAAQGLAAAVEQQKLEQLAEYQQHLGSMQKQLDNAAELSASDARKIPELTENLAEAKRVKNRDCA